MARSTTAAEDTALADLEARDFLRVEVEDPDTNYQDVSALLGVDWLDGCTISLDQDAPVMSATIRLARGHAALSTAPLMSASLINRNAATAYAEFFRPGVGVRIYAAKIIGSAPIASDWKLMFRGTCDDVDVGEDQTVLTCRGPGATLMDRLVEDEGQTYGPGPIETVIQQILNDWAPGETLVTPVSPSFQINEYEQAQQPVMDATQLAMALELIGWDMRYRYSDGAGDFELQLRDPGRSNTTPDHTLGPSQYFTVPGSKLSRRDVRNAVKLSYVDAADSTRKTVTYTNLASITKYGRRFLGIRLASDNQINSPAEANNLVSAIGPDLSDVPISHSIEATFYWPVQLGDIVRLTDDAVHHDFDLDLAVFRITHNFTPDRGASTTLDMRGNPSAAYENWRGLRGGEDPSTDERLRLVETKVSFDVITYGAPPQPDNGDYKVYLSVSPLSALVQSARITFYDHRVTGADTTRVTNTNTFGEPVEIGNIVRSNVNALYEVVLYSGPNQTGTPGPVLSRRFWAPDANTQGIIRGTDGDGSVISGPGIAVTDKGFALQASADGIGVAVAASRALAGTTGSLNVDRALGSMFHVTATGNLTLNPTNFGDSQGAIVFCTMGAFELTIDGATVSTGEPWMGDCVVSFARVNGKTWAAVSSQMVAS